MVVLGFSLLRSSKYHKEFLYLVKWVTRNRNKSINSFGKTKLFSLASKSSSRFQNTLMILEGILITNSFTP